MALSVHPITDDAHLIKVLSAKLLHHKVTLYLFFDNFYNFVAGYFETT